MIDRFTEFSLFIREPKECIVFELLICRSAASAHTAAAKWEQNRTWEEETPFYD